ncbi:retinol dehydrogenase 14 [Aspergillus udagawae]|uniref:Retinol dehydrogenase 14 n=1 Tax=Aspergillus udagawae TaxID=91492 RepID=A0A8H3NG95_9EURO|nr:retinol dehydrogenase 14 [Aspergillus udagawae]
MNFPQPKVTLLPSDLDLHGKTAVVTGATAGIGLETAQQLLKLKISNFILAVRNVSKGEECKQELQQLNITAKIMILELNMDDYKSVRSFATALQREVSVVDILILNADKKAPLKAGESVLEHMDSKEFFLANQRYNNSKLLCAMFMYSLAPRLDKSRINLNMVCPGLVNTSMTDVLPLHMRMVMGVVKTLFARPVEVGGRLFIHAAVVAGPESHGRFLGDKDIIEPSPYLLSPAGQAVQKSLWAETIAEMGRLTDLPPEFTTKE